MMAFLLRLCNRYRHVPSSDEEHAEIDRRLREQRERLDFLRAVADVQERRQA